MGQVTAISWCDHTFNPWEGCAKISPGCKHCYAEAQHKFLYASLGKEGQPGTCWGLNAPRLARAESYWNNPLKWNADALDAGVRRRVFCLSMGDVFEAQSPKSRSHAGQTGIVPTGPGKTRTVMFTDIAAERLRLLRLIYDTPQLDWLLLTKRPENIVHALSVAFGMIERNGAFSLWLGEWIMGTPPQNVWLGTSVENQEQADARIPHLLAAPAAVRFLSCEPLLGAVDLASMRCNCALAVDGEVCPSCNDSGRFLTWIDWVIVGGESGKNPSVAPMHPDWALQLRDQCAAASVAFHFKQWGEWLPISQLGYDSSELYKPSKAAQRLINEGTDPGTAVDVYGEVCTVPWVTVHYGGEIERPGDTREHMLSILAKYPHGTRQMLMFRVGVDKSGRLLDGRQHDAVPAPRLYTGPLSGQ